MLAKKVFFYNLLNPEHFDAKQATTRKHTFLSNVQKAWVLEKCTEFSDMSEKKFFYAFTNEGGFKMDS